MIYAIKREDSVGDIIWNFDVRCDNRGVSGGGGKLQEEGQIGANDRLLVVGRKAVQESLA